MNRYDEHRNLDSYPTAMLLALNKAKTVSWRMGIAWTLISNRGEVLTCNGGIFNNHNQPLIEDLKTYRNAKKLYISYCPAINDLYSRALLDTLKLSNLAEINVFACEKEKNAINELVKQTAIPTVRWCSDQEHFGQTTGVAWVRSTRRPWINVVCSMNLNEGMLSQTEMYRQLGVTHYIALKGLESSALYVQEDQDNAIGSQFNLVNPQPVRSRKKMIHCLNDLSVSTQSVVTVVCDPDWLALIVRMSLANEVTYFQSLNIDGIDTSPRPALIKFLEKNQWTVNSSEVMGRFMKFVLQTGYSFSSEINDHYKPNALN